VPTFQDEDGPDTIITYEDYAHWLSADADSIFGVPMYGDNDTSFVVIVSDGYKADTEKVQIVIQQTTPEIRSVFVDDLDSNLHVINDVPLFSWNYYDPTDTKAQTQFEIAVGTDDDWTYAEMWNPAPFTSSDTFTTYNGSPLTDGDTYYLRLRVHNGYNWSQWYNTLFRLNSMPSIPVQRWPINDEVINVQQPYLWIENSTDNEGDSLTYDFFYVVDTAFGEPDTVFKYNFLQGTDSTGWEVTWPFVDNWHYYWGVRSYDQYEHSNWTDPATGAVWDNFIEEPPGDFQIQYPPDTSGYYVFDMLTDFLWEPSNEPDPLDSVYYTLSLSLDSNFAFVNRVDSLWQPWFTATDSLEFATQYWWKVKATDNTGRFTYSSNILTFKTWKLGDANGDWQVNIFDITFIITYLYLDGPAPGQLIMGDVNGDCVINIFDITYLIAHLYLDGPAPQVGCE
jgi:hypothetical protein